MSKVKNNLSSEVIKRLGLEKTDSIVGHELRSARLKQNMTLSGVAKDTCSTSYLCKVEMNRIIPNRLLLEEICEKLSIDPNRIDALIESKENILKCVKAFLHEDYETIDKIYGECENFENYRAKVMGFIKDIAEKDMLKASNFYKELLPQLSIMGEFDLAIFGLFSGIYHFFIGEFDEAEDDLASLDQLPLEDDARTLKELYQFYNDLKRSKKECILSYEKICRKLEAQGDYKLVEKISYYLGIYYAKYQIESGFNDVKNRIGKEEYYNTLNYLYRYYGGFEYIGDYRTKMVSDFVIALINLNVDPDTTREILDYKAGKVELDFDYYYIEYMLLNEKDKSKYIVKYFAPIVETSRDEYLTDFFLKELIRLSEKEGRYRQIFEYHRIVSRYKR